MSGQADSPETMRLLERARQGDQAALDELLQQHRPFLRRLVELRLDPKLRARIDPSDVVQEAQLEAAVRLHNYLDKPAIPFRLWLRRLAVDQLLMARRRHLRDKRSVAREEPLDDSSFALTCQLVDAAATPSQRLAREELADKVRGAVGRLAQDDCDVLMMRTYEGLSFEEVACLLGIQPAAARQRHGRAILRLHKLLAEEGITGAGP